MLLNSSRAWLFCIERMARDEIRSGELTAQMNVTVSKRSRILGAVVHEVFQLFFRHRPSASGGYSRGAGLVEQLSHRALSIVGQSRGKEPPKFGMYFNCAGRGSALYGQAGLDPELIQRRFGNLPLAGIESSFEIAPTCGKPRIHMFTGVLLLAG